ncbi:MAG: AAA family ATPase [Akkermansiaceae bacterium]|nr:AAA family ATPase [Akkermansiaceae bacterium]
MPDNKNIARFVASLCDHNLPAPHRIEMLSAIAGDTSADAKAARKKIIALLANADGEEAYKSKIEELRQKIRDLEEGPYRPAYFVGILNDGGPSILAQVLLDDGTTAYPVVTDEKLARALKAGHRVLLDRQGKMVVGRAIDDLRTGDQARLERVLPNGRVEVSLRGEERAIFLASQRLLDHIDSGAVEPGASLVVQTRLFLALDVVPPVDGISHYRFLDNSPVPDVVPERDMGAPPLVITKVIDHVRTELMQPDLRRAYKCPRSRFFLFTGPPGTGKTMTIYGITRGVYEAFSEATGIPVEDVPPIVFKLRASEILDPYVGVAERNIDRFYDEIEKRAAETVTGPDGREWPIPVMIVMEELDALGRHRGQHLNGVHDRLMATMLQRLDQGRPELRDHLMIFIGTTNVVEQVDAAFLRRIGGEVVSFGPLKRRAFAAVLEKHLAGRPVAAANGNGARPAADHERALRDELCAYLFSPNGSDPGVVELNFTGAASPEVRYKRDFLNADLVSRSVKEACNEAAADERREGREAGGLSFERLARAFDAQIRSVAAQLNEHNVTRFLELPDAVRVASVRRLPQPGVSPLELQNR